MKIPFIWRFLEKREEAAFVPTEVSPGDIERIDEIKQWLKEKKKEQWIEEKLKKMGYNQFHTDFLMRKATGRKEPKLPEDLIKRKEERKKQKRRVKYEIMTIIVAIILLYLFLRMGMGMDISNIIVVLEEMIVSAIQGAL